MKFVKRGSRAAPEVLAFFACLPAGLTSRSSSSSSSSSSMRLLRCCAGRFMGSNSSSSLSLLLPACQTPQQCQHMHPLYHWQLLLKNNGSVKPQYWQSKPPRSHHLSAWLLLKEWPLNYSQTVQHASLKVRHFNQHLNLLLGRRRGKEEGTIQSASEVRPALAQQEQEGRGRGPRAVPVVQI